MTSSSFNWTLNHIAQVVEGELVGGDQSVSGVSTDSRSITKDNLFIALKGPSFDGHDYVYPAEQKSAAAVLVNKSMTTNLPQIIVKDTLSALGKLAGAWRNQFSIPVIGITGSNGKTTVKEITTSILSCTRHVLATEGNFNNDIGMPLTLLKIDKDHEAAVIEMGANHAGEIEYLTKISCPSIVVVTNAGPAHLEGFGDLDGVAKSKGEIYEQLAESGTAILNADDHYYKFWQGLCDGKKTLSFGLSSDADISARHGTNHVSIITPGGDINVNFKMLGKHNLMNALAATAVCCAVGVSLDAIKQGLEKMQGVMGRLQLKAGQNGSRIIDDTYNANPASLDAALAVLNEFSGQHLLALGDMGELGAETEQLHIQAGERARMSGVHKLYTLGQHARCAANSFGSNSKVFDDKPSMISELKNCMADDVTLLVKGSRLMKMEVIVDALVQSVQSGDK